MTTESAAGKSSGGRGLRIALIASLALNVLIVGAVAGMLVFGRHHGWKHHGYRGLMGFARTLPAERGDEIREKLKSERAALAPLRKAEREARVEARSILMTEPFDLDRFKAALKRAAEADASEKKARMAVFAQMVATLTPEERQQLHKWFERRRKHFRRYWKKHD